MVELDRSSATSTYQTVSMLAPMIAMNHLVSLDIDGSSTEERTASMKTAILGFKNAMKKPSTKPYLLPCECSISLASARIISIPK